MSAWAEDWPPCTAANRLALVWRKTISSQPWSSTTRKLQIGWISTATVAWSLSCAGPSIRPKARGGSGRALNNSLGNWRSWWVRWSHRLVCMEICGGGNLHIDERGKPCLIDPAVYGGHREMDLAMMKLFGGFSPRVFEAYHEAYPLAPGFHERIPLYQLYPLLVHVNLFGGGYVGSVESALSRYL